MEYYSSFQKMALSYGNEKNYFNAIKAYEESISRLTGIFDTKSKYLCYNNLAVAYQKLGLWIEYSECRDKVNRYVENNIGMDVDTKILYRLNYAKQLKSEGNYQKAKEQAILSTNDGFSFNTNDGACRILAELELEESNLDRASIYFDILFRKSKTKNAEIIARINQARLLRQFNYHKEAVEALLPYCDINIITRTTSDILNKNLEILHYETGKCFYQMSDNENAIKYFEIAKSYGSSLDYYDKSKLTNGQIFYINKNEGFGLIVYFKDGLKTIPFLLSDSFTNVSIGDFVLFDSVYRMVKDRFQFLAYKITPYINNFNPLLDKRDKHIIHLNEIYHQGIAYNFSVSHIFFPFECLVPVNNLHATMNSDTQEITSINKNTFLEGKTSVGSENKIEAISTLLSFPNSYSNKRVGKVIGKESYKNEYEPSRYSSRVCPVCGADEDEGCQMSDPQSCPNGKGI